MIEKVKIGGMNYDIVFKDLTTRNDDFQGLQLGWHVLADNLIEINSRVCKERQEQTLVHEIFHGIVNEAGLELENEEDIVNRISLVLYQVLKDNDFSWIREKDNGTQTIITGGKNYLLNENNELEEVD